MVLLGGEPPAGLRHGQDDARVARRQDVLHARVQLLLEPRVELCFVVAGEEQLLRHEVAGRVKGEGEEAAREDALELQIRITSKFIWQMRIGILKLQ